MRHETCSLVGVHRFALIVSMVVGASACASGTGSSPSATPVPSGVTVDVLDYLIGASSLWPRVGNHSQNQVVDYARQEVCWVKYANPRMFECWRWDDAFVYHVVDHGIDGNTGESYSFSDGRWLPRRLSGVWTLDLRYNQISWFDPNCRMVAPRSFPYRQRAWIDPARDGGGDVGIRETLVLEYQPYRPGRKGRRSRAVLFREGRRLVRVGSRRRPRHVQPRGWTGRNRRARQRLPRVLITAPRSFTFAGPAGATLFVATIVRPAAWRERRCPDRARSA